MGEFLSTSYAEAFTITETIGRLGYCNPETIPMLLAALNGPPNLSPGFHDRAAFVLLQLSQSMEIVNVACPDAFHGLGFNAARSALSKALNAPNDMPLCLGATLKSCCGSILKSIDPEAAAKAGVK